MTTQESLPAAGTDSRLAAARELLRRRVRAALDDTAAGPATVTAPVPAPAADGPDTEPVASFAQERMWLVDRMTDGTPGYAIPEVVRLRGPVHQAAAPRPDRRRGPSRTAAHRLRGARRRPAPGGPARPGGRSAAAAGPGRRPLAELEERAHALAREEVRRPFDLASGPLLRALLIRLGAEGHLLVLVVHHIATDGWSMGLLWQELSEGYAALLARRPLPGPRSPWTTRRTPVPSATGSRAAR